MHRPTLRKRPLARFLGQAAAVLAFVAQLAVVAAGLAEGRSGIGYGAHYDRGGTSTHYVHDEALCAACQARSVHGVARIPQPPKLGSAPEVRPVAARAPSFVDRDSDFGKFSRAPPTVI